MAYAGTTGLPGSFYVKTDELVEIDAPPVAQLPPPQVATAAPSTQATPASPPREADIEPSAVTTPQPATRPTQRGDRTQARPPVTSGYIDAPEARLPQTQPMPPPKVGLPSSGVSQPSGSSGSGAPAFVVVAFLVGGFFVLMRMFRKQPAPRTRRAPEMAGGAAVGARPSVSARATGPVPAKTPTLVVWHPKNSAVTVAGHGIGGGMIYVGAHEPSRARRVSLLHRSGPGGRAVEPGHRRGRDAVLAVLQPDPTPAAGWPTSSGSRPAAPTRRSASATSSCSSTGWSDACLSPGPAPAGETDAIAAEVGRLLRTYGANRSFAGYAHGILEAIATKRLLDGSGGAAFVPDLEAPAHAMPLPLRVAIADRVSRREPLGFAFAVAGALGQPAETMPVEARVLNHARPQLLEILKPRFVGGMPAGPAARAWEGGGAPAAIPQRDRRASGRSRRIGPPAAARPRPAWHGPA